MEASGIHAAEYGVQAGGRNMEDIGEVPGHEPVGSNDGVCRLAVQPAVHKAILGQAAVSACAYEAEAMFLLQERPEDEGFTSVAVHDVGAELADESVHASPGFKQFGRRGGVERQSHGTQAHLLRFFKRRSPFQTGHYGFMPGVLEAFGQRYAIPCGSVVPADVHDLYGAHGNS